MELQALPSRIGQVRRIVSAQLRYWHLDALTDHAVLGVTELLSNVHRHARPDKSCTVELRLLADRLTVSVRDHDPRLPVLVEGAADAVPEPHAAADDDAAPLSTCGRGLAMVAAVSESWGARPDGDDGKIVWFTLPATPVTNRQPASRTSRRATERSVTPRRTEVQPVVTTVPPKPTPVTVAPAAVTVGPTPGGVAPAAVVSHTPVSAGVSAASG